MIPSCKNLFLNQIANFKSFHESHKLNWKTVVRVFVSYGHEQLGGKKRTKCNNHPWIVFTKRFPKVFSRKRGRRCVSKHRGRFPGKTWQNSTKDRGYEKREATWDLRHLLVSRNFWFRPTRKRKHVTQTTKYISSRMNSREPSPLSPFSLHPLLPFSRNLFHSRSILNLKTCPLFDLNAP